MAGIPSAHGDAQRFRVLNYLRSFEEQNGYLPTIAGVVRALGMTRTSITWHLAVLREDGVLDYVDGNPARSLRLLAVAK